MSQHDDEASPFTLRHDLRPGDLGAVVRLHGVVYARESGFDPTFEAYVAAPWRNSSWLVLPARLWLAERGADLVGCIAIVSTSATAAQLRWFLVAPPARGAGLGTRLLREAVAFARCCGCDSLCLWTVSTLTAAARLYRSAGFVRVEARPGRRWGIDVVEEKYELRLGNPGAVTVPTGPAADDPSGPLRR